MITCEDLIEAVNNIGMMVDQSGMTAEEFCEYLKSLTTPLFSISENEIKFDGDMIYILPTQERPLKIVFDAKDVTRIDFDS